MKIRATLVELWKRFSKFDKNEKVYFNGENNLYPNEIERVVLNSPTADKASNIMSKFIVGLGLTVDPKLNGVLLSDISKDIADDISVQYGSFIHVSYRIEVKGENFTLVPAGFKVLDYVKCRKSKEDDNDNSGKIIYKDYEENTGFLTRTKDDKKWYYPYSNNQEVIKKQIRTDGKDILKGNKDAGIDLLLPHYRGQVFYLNLTPKYEYAISRFNSVYNDCDTEYRVGLYTNNSSRTGFLGKLAILVSGLSKETSEKIQKDVADWLGAENSGSVYYLEIEDTDDLEKNFKIINVPSQYNEEQFEGTKKDARINILGAANNVPGSLVFGSEGTSLFGSSGELIEQMKLFYTEQTAWERKKIEETFKMFGFKTKIIPLITLEKEIEKDEE